MELKDIHFFAMAYAVLGIVAAASLALGIYLWTNPTDHVTKKQLAAVAGDQNLIAVCEGGITSQIQQNFGEVKGYTNVKVTVSGDKAVVKLHVASTIFSGNLACKFSKSNWQLQSFGAA